MKGRSELRVGLAIVALAAALGLALLALWGRERAPARATREAPAPEPALEQPLPAAPAPLTRSVAAVTAAEHEQADEPRGFEHPHPITPEHERNFRQVDLLDDAWKALKVKDFVRARALVATHRSEYPGQWEDMNLGLEILAECMENADSRIVQRAQEFYDRYTASRMRRRIRRFCLEPWQHEAGATRNRKSNDDL